jgi:predicted nucleotidyltransferase
MLEQLNPNFIIKGLILIHSDHQDKVTTYNLDYRKDDVIRMLGFHKKQKMIELEKQKNSPIIF